MRVRRDGCCLVTPMSAVWLTPMSDVDGQGYQVTCRSLTPSRLGASGALSAQRENVRERLTNQDDGLRAAHSFILDETTQQSFKRAARQNPHRHSFFYRHGFSSCSDA